MGPPLFGGRHPRPGVGCAPRCAPSAPKSSCWARLRARFKSKARVACKSDHHDEASTTASISQPGSWVLSEFDGVICRAGSGSLCGEDMPGVPDLPDSPRASARPDKSTRRFSHRAGTEGWTVNDFEIVRTLGHGSMGSVHMVRRATGRATTPYALKVIDKGRVVREHQVARVMQEKQLLGLASHPFVVRLVGTFQDDARLFMITEFVGGGELFSAIGSAKFDDACAHFFAAEVTLALCHIHSLDIAYRDLKPENVVIDSLGHAKIIDFGLAKVVQTRTYTVCGTVEYMAPEVLSKIGHGRCVDWWALGTLIFEMLAFQAPFNGRTARETRKNVLNRDPRCPAYFGSVTKGIVHLLLIKDQTLRLGSGADGGRRVQGHPWFSTVEWGELLRQRCLSPFLPGVHGDSGPPTRGSLSEPGADDCAAGGLQEEKDEVAARAVGGLSEAQQRLFRGF